MEPLVSILIPAFNAERFLADALASALAQTWHRIEVIVVDDGSTDGTRSVAERFASASVKIVAQPHQGASAARNRALSLSQGDYMQWLDADDVLSSGKIERQIAALDEGADSGTLLTCAWGRFLSRPSRARFQATSLWQDLPPTEWLLRKMEGNVFMQTGTWLVSRELTSAAGPWDTSLSVDDDGEYFCRVLLRSRQVRFVPDAAVYYRQSGMKRLSCVGRSSQKMESTFRATKLHVRYLRSVQDDARARAACVTYLRNSLITFHPDRPDLVQEALGIAAALGHSLEAPKLPWKYAWLAPIVGESAAKHASILLPQARESLARWCDRVSALVHEGGAPSL